MQPVNKIPLLVFVMITLAALNPKAAESRSLMERDFHPIDICIFTCDMCYKGEALVHCANECITSEANMGPFWTRTCKLFAGGSVRGLHEAGPPNTNFGQ